MRELREWFTLIRAINKRPTTIKELDLITEVPKPTLYRYIKMLHDMGIVEQDGVAHEAFKVQTKSGKEYINLTTEKRWKLSWLGRGLIRYIREMKL